MMMEMKTYDPQMVVADNIEWLKRTTGIGKTKMARLAGIDPHSISRIVARQMNCRMMTLDALAGVFGLPLWKMLQPHELWEENKWNTGE